jgi:phosphoribosylanthranilate isomerase
MAGTVVQVYEIQTPDEAEAMLGLGVDHVGSVITSLDNGHNPVIRQTIATVRKMGATSSLIPLLTDPIAVFDILDYYQPHIVHFCDRLDGNDGSIEAALALQTAVKVRFSEIQIMRSIPIGRTAGTTREAVFALAARLEPLSDYFLTDTLIVDPLGAADGDQPVKGFVGITGLTCDWGVAAQLTARSRIPVILAGGIAPENVAEAIRQVRPFGVDSCTCTNALDANGRPIRFKKDPARVKALVAETRRADNQTLDGW